MLRIGFGFADDNELVMHLRLQAVITLMARVIFNPPAPGEFIRFGIRSGCHAGGLEKLRAKRAGDFTPRAVGVVTFAIPKLAYLRADLGRRRRPPEIAEPVVECRLQFEFPVAAQRNGRLPIADCRLGGKLRFAW